MSAIDELRGMLRESYMDDDLRRGMDQLTAADQHARAIVIMDEPLPVMGEHRFENEIEEFAGPLPDGISDDDLDLVLRQREGSYYIGLAVGLRIAEQLRTSDETGGERTAQPAAG